MKLTTGITSNTLAHDKLCCLFRVIMRKIWATALFNIKICIKYHHLASRFTSIMFYQWWEYKHWKDISMTGFWQSSVISKEQKGFAFTKRPYLITGHFPIPMRFTTKLIVQEIISPVFADDHLGVALFSVPKSYLHQLPQLNLLTAKKPIKLHTFM